MNNKRQKKIMRVLGIVMIAGIIISMLAPLLRPGY